VGGAAFIVPGLIVILALSVLFLASSPPLWVLGAGAGADAAVPAVAVNAGVALISASWQRRADTGRWLVYLIAGIAAAATLGVWLVLVLLGAGLIELAIRTTGPGGAAPLRSLVAAPALARALTPVAAAAVAGGGVLASVAWVAIKVGGLSYGGGFVIIPLMQADAVGHYHWMSSAQFLDAVALGQITPGPVVQTVAVVGYAAAGLAGGLLAALVAFAPSFGFVLAGGPRFDRIRGDRRARAFLDGAGPAAIGAILGSAVSLTRALAHPWQYAVLAAAVITLLALRRGVVLTLLAAATVGVVIALAAGTISP
jgi:chromate transporter